MPSARSASRRRLLGALAGLSGLPLLWKSNPARADEYVVFILTPQTGTWAPLGKSMRNGIAIALEQAEDGGRFREGVRLSLQDYDDNEAPEALAKRVTRDVVDNDGILVIGPLLSSHAEILSVAANRNSFPLLTPAVSAQITATGPWAYRSGASPQLLLASMTQSAIRRAKARKVAVIFPGENDGFAAQARIIALAAGQAGSFVVGELALNSDDTSFEEVAGSLSTVSCDMIFICMDAEPGGVVASRLRKAGISAKSQFVFPPAAAMPALIEVGREYVEGAWVAADYLPELPGELNQAFVATYADRYGERPDRWAGLGYTTGLIAAEGVRLAGPAPSRPLMRDALERITSLKVPMGGGTWNLKLHHEPYYEPAFVSIRNGKFVPIDPAGT